MLSNIPLFVWIDLDGPMFDWGAKVLQYLPQYKNVEELNKSETRVKDLTDLYTNFPDLFAFLPKAKGALTLMKLVQSSGIEFGFLSAIGDIHPYPQMVIGNKAFTLHLLDKTYSRRLTCVPFSEHKQHYANEYSLLIDDYEKNVAEFSLMGGTSILYKGPDDFGALYDGLKAWLIKHNRSTQRLDGKWADLTQMWEKKYGVYHERQILK